MSDPGPNHSVVPLTLETRRLAERLYGDLDALATQTFEFMAEQIPELKSDEGMAAATYATCVSTIELGLAMLRRGVPAERTEAPAAAIEHARYMAAHGAGIEATLRFYRLGHAYFWERWATELEHAVDDPERLVAAMRETAAFTFGYIDVISAKVSAEMVAERDRRQRRMSAVRQDTVAALLAGELTDVDRAEHALGFALSGPLLAFLCWTDRDPATLEPAAGLLAAAAGSERPLLLTDGPRGLAGWVRVGRHALPHLTAAGPALAAGAPGVHVALGDPGSGLEGFRESRDQAERARRVAQLSHVAAPSFTRFEDVALVDLLSGDLPAARALVHRELGRLSAPDDRTWLLRETLLAYLAAHGNHNVAAHALGVHRNTARQRLYRAEDLRGRPITQHAAELLAALLLAQALGRAVLAPA